MPRRLPAPKGNEKIWLGLTPPESRREHGRHIYMFRNTQTNQILYTMEPKIQQRTLSQLPFIGKHSVPARIRPDLWAAHCRIGPFATSQQGHDAMAKLSEFRLRHFTEWHTTNPEWARDDKKKLIRNIMNQRANATADLAQVFRIHETLGKAHAEKYQARVQQQEKFLDARWATLEQKAATATDARVQEIEKAILGCKNGIASKLSPEKTVERLNKQLASLRHELKQLLWARRICEQRDAAQKKLDHEHQQALLDYEKSSDSTKALGPPRPKRNPVRDSLLPPALKPMAEPFTLEGIECLWADLYDAQYANEWPSAIAQGALKRTARREAVAVENKERTAFGNRMKRIATAIAAEERKVFVKNRERRRVGSIHSRPVVPLTTTRRIERLKGVAKTLQEMEAKRLVARAKIGAAQGAEEKAAKRAAQRAESSFQSLGAKVLGKTGTKKPVKTAN